MIKIIIFDFDGVILENYELHYKLSQKQITDITREEHKMLFDGNVHIEREKLAHRDTGFDLRLHFSETKEKAQIKPQTIEVLRALSKSYMLGIITSANESGIEKCLIYNNLDDLFSFSYGYETAKLKVDKFEKVFKENDVSADECLFVTDTLGDILEANAVGLKAIGVDFGFHEKERLLKGNPIAIVSEFTQLSEIIDAQ